MFNTKTKKITFYSAIAFIALLIIAFLSFKFWLSSQNKAIEPNSKKNYYIQIKKGTSFTNFANKLKKKSIISSVFAAKYYWWKNSYTLKAGFYKLLKSYPLKKILFIISSGKEHLFKLTIPEGLYLDEIAELLKKRVSDKVATEFLKAAQSKALLKKYKIPFNNADGYLFPSTYFLPKNISGSELAKKMIETFYKKVPAHFNELSLDQQKKALVLASIIEKEAVKDNERALMASVFKNRIAKGMRLESCATIMYVFDKRGQRKHRLLNVHLKVNSPYNTYLFYGLPPSPIANPGLESLKAALNPKDSKYLYFVHKGNGSHYFSKSLVEHNRAKRKYRKFWNQRKK